MPETVERPVELPAPLPARLSNREVTQIRVPVLPQPLLVAGRDGRARIAEDAPGVILTRETPGGPYAPVRCPLGVPGDRLWVREAWAVSRGSRSKLLARRSLVEVTFDQEGVAAHVIFPTAERWRLVESEQGIRLLGRPRQARFLPRHLARLVLAVTAVRCERLGVISREDCLAEGVRETSPGLYDAGGWDSPFSARHAYAQWWDARHPDRGLRFADQPWTWVATVEKVTDASADADPLAPDDTPREDAEEGQEVLL